MEWIKDFDAGEVDISPELQVKLFNSEQHFQKYVAPLKPTYPKVTLDKWEVDYLDDRAEEIIKRKMTEDIHKKDSNSEEKRWRTGLYSEAAVCKFFGWDFTDVLDLSVRDSRNFLPDLNQAGYAVGVKGVSWGDYPLMYPKRQDQQPEVIVFRDGRDVFYIAGLAVPSVLTDPKNFRDDFVRQKEAREKEKSAFTAMDKLQPLTIQSIYPYRSVF